MRKTKMSTLPESAATAGVTPELVRRWARSGKIPSQRLGVQWLVDVADVQRYAASRAERIAAKRPRKK